MDSRRLFDGKTHVANRSVCLRWHSAGAKLPSFLDGIDVDLGGQHSLLLRMEDAWLGRSLSVLLDILSSYREPNTLY